jgi:hypothetical protein
MKTTLNQIKAKSPCTNGWKKLLKHLNKTTSDDDQLSIVTILESNGLDDALWCLRAVDGKDKEIRLYAVWCARQVQHLMKDKRSIAALDVAERFANGLATYEELQAAGDATSDAARAAWFAACDAARAVAWAAAMAAARVDAWDDASDAAWAAAMAAAMAAQKNKLIEICAE